MDKKAKKILFKTFWSGAGWTKNRTVSPEDFAYAKAHGLMFDPVSFSHDQCIGWIHTLRDEIPEDKAARGFLASLSTRRLDWRSGLASMAVAHKTASHSYTPKAFGSMTLCGVCAGAHPHRDQYRDVDVNVLNFERFKWGGVRHGHLEYTWFDLQQLAQAEVPEPGREDIRILKALLAAVAASAPGDHPSALEKRLAPVLASSKSERRSLIEILACADILKPASRDRACRGDWVYAAPWRGEDGYDDAAVEALFGQWLV